MSVRIMALIFEANFADCQVQSRKVSAATAKFVCLALADHCNDEGKGAYPSVDRLAHKVNMTSRTVIFALRALEIMGIIKASGISEYGTKDYTISIEAVKELEKYTPIYRDESDDINPEGLKVTTLGAESDDKKVSLLSDKPSLKPSLNQSALTSKKYKERIAESMRKFEEKRLSGQTDFGWLDEGLVHFARAFVRAWNPDYQPMNREYSLWKSELWEWQRLGITDDIIERTVAKMRKENLTIKSPKSITGIALDMKAKGSVQDELPPVYHADLGGLSEQEWYKQNYHK
jgi:hypothetical protein